MPEETPPKDTTQQDTPEGTSQINSSDETNIKEQDTSDPTQGEGNTNVEEGKMVDKSGAKELIIGILVVVILALLAIVILLFVGKGDNPDSNVTPTPIATTAPTEITPTTEVTTTVSEVTPTIDPYTGWKVYNSTELGINFKYPTNYKIETLKNDNDTVIKIPLSDGRSFMEISTTKPDYSYKQSTNVTDEFTTKDNKGNTISTEAFVNADGGPGYLSANLTHVYKLEGNIYIALDTFSEETSTYCNNGSVDTDSCASESNCIASCEGFTKEVVSESSTSKEDINNALLIIASIGPDDRYIDWKTYRDRDFFNIKFRYPKGSKIEPDRKLRIIKISNEDKGINVIIASNMTPYSFPEYTEPDPTNKINTKDLGEIIPDLYVFGEGLEGRGYKSETFTYKFGQDLYGITSKGKTTTYTYCNSSPDEGSQNSCKKDPNCSNLNDCTGFKNSIVSENGTTEEQFIGAKEIISSIEFL